MGLGAIDVDLDPNLGEQDGDALVTTEDDGSVTVDYGANAELSGEPEKWFDNLVPYLDSATLGRIANELLDGIDADLGSREQWEENYKEGIKLLGLSPEKRSEPFDGACGVFSTLLLEGVIRFQAEAASEMLPASGPVLTRVIGTVTDELEAQAERVKDSMNYYLTEGAEEYYPDYDQMLFYLPLNGSVFKKVYRDPIEDRPVSPFVLPDDFIVSYAATALEKAARATHRTFPTQDEIKRLQLTGYYADVQLVPDDSSELEASRETIDQAEGRSASILDGVDERYTRYETMCSLDLPKPFGAVDKEGEPTGIRLPYIVTIENTSRQVLRVERNWQRDDPKQKPQSLYAHYKYMPGLGFYGLSMVDLVRNAVAGHTSILRQTIDAGTFANMQGGFKAKDARLDNDEVSIAPGQFQDVDLGGLDDINKAILPFAFPGPNASLIALGDKLEATAQRLLSTADMPTGDPSYQNAPVGTTLALIEQACKPQSGVMKRLHRGMKSELRMFRALFAEDPDSVWPYQVKGKPGTATGADFADIVDVVPVSDPNVPTQVQRNMRVQTLLQMAESAPQDFDARKIRAKAVREMDMDPDEVMTPDPMNVQPMDPASENAAMIMGKPVKAGEFQDHDAHIQSHMLFAQSNQQMIAQNPQVMAAGKAHMMEHVALKYRRQLETTIGQPLPPFGTPLPPEIELKLSQAIAQASQQMAQQAQAGQPPQIDPNMVKMRELDVKEKELGQKEQDSQRKASDSIVQNQTEIQKQTMDLTNDREERASKERLADKSLQGQVLEHLSDVAAAHAKTHQPTGGFSQ